MNASFETSINPWLVGINRTPEPAPLPSGIIRLDCNERVGPYPESIAKAILSRLSGASLSHYPDTSALYRALEQQTTLQRANLLLVPGSDAAFRALAHTYVSADTRVVMLHPSYQMYPVYTRMFGGVPIQVQLRSDMTVDWDEVAEQSTKSTMLWLANPNQPSGTVVTTEQIMTLASRVAKTGGLVVVDEAYYPFGGVTVLDQVTAHENLVVVRSFSKACGLAGIRLGFVAASPKVIATLFKVRASFDINALAIAAGKWALEHPDMITHYVHEAGQSAGMLRAVASQHDLFAPPSFANFQLIKVAPLFDPIAVKHACYSRGYAIHVPTGPAPFGDYIRVTLGTLDVMEGFSAVLHQILTALDTQRESGLKEPLNVEIRS